MMSEEEFAKLSIKEMQEELKAMVDKVPDEHIKELYAKVKKFYDEEQSKKENK